MATAWLCDQEKHNFCIVLRARALCSEALAVLAVAALWAVAVRLADLRSRRRLAVQRRHAGQHAAQVSESAPFRAGVSRTSASSHRRQRSHRRRRRRAGRPWPSRSSRKCPPSASRRTPRLRKRDVLVLRLGRAKHRRGRALTLRIVVVDSREAGLTCGAGTAGGARAVCAHIPSHLAHGGDRGRGRRRGWLAVGRANRAGGAHLRVSAAADGLVLVAGVVTALRLAASVGAGAHDNNVLPIRAANVVDSPDHGVVVLAAGAAGLVSFDLLHSAQPSSAANAGTLGNPWRHEGGGQSTGCRTKGWGRSVRTARRRHRLRRRRSTPARPQ